MKRLNERGRVGLAWGATGVLWLLVVSLWIGFRVYGAEGVLEQRAVRMAILQLSFVEAALIALSVPLFALNIKTFESRELMNGFSGTARAIVWSASLGLVLVGSSLVGLSMAGALWGGMAFTSVLASQWVLCGFVLAIASGAVLVTRWSANVVDAAGVVYGLVAACVAGLILIGPVASAVGSNGLVQSALVVNPFVGVASALEFDLLRSEWLYRISPVARRGFQYPSPYAATAVYAFGTALFALGATRKRRPAGHGYRSVKGRSE